MWATKHCITLMEFHSDLNITTSFLDEQLNALNVLLQKDQQATQLIFKFIRLWIGLKHFTLYRKIDDYCSILHFPVDPQFVNVSQVYLMNRQELLGNAKCLCL